MKPARFLPLLKILKQPGASHAPPAACNSGTAEKNAHPVSRPDPTASIDRLIAAIIWTSARLQMSTLRHLALAWVLTLPVAMILSGSLYWLFSHLC
jgi:inorganic phosphate transporter, PiT family